MKKIILLCTLVIWTLPLLLSANFTYLSDEEYQQLSRRERNVYLDNLETEMANIQQRKADAIARHQENLREIEDLRSKIASIDREYEVVYTRIINNLNLTSSEIEEARRKIDEYRRKIDNWMALSDSELWNNVRTIRQTIEEYEAFKETQVAKAPDFRDDIAEIDRKIVNLENSIDRARPPYHEDNYTVERGDYLAKIAGYSFIYDDTSKWPIIFRANRDQIRDPNLIYPDQVLKIPRGLPHTWRVYRGESLWRIASYPEVYGRGIDWPLIYRANQDQIKDPDLIYPDQVFTIPRD